MDLPEHIETIRCTILGNETGYWEEVCGYLNAMRRTIVTYAHTKPDLIGLVYDFEPMLILMELTPENIGIINYVSYLHRYRQAFSIGMCEENLKGFKQLEKYFLVSTVLMKKETVRDDAMSIMRKFKRNYRYGINLRSLTDKMPISNDICWHDYSWDDRFTREFISEKLDRLGVRKELEGHKYLIAAIAMNYAMRSVPEPVKLYSRIAEYYDTTPAAVEKAIRYAIETAWIVGDIDYQHMIFGMTIDEEKGKPTNSEFIARLALDDYWKQ